MNRQQKEEVIKTLQKDFSDSTGSFFVRYSGLTVKQMQQLRGMLREKGGTLKVAKMRLVKRALIGLEDVDFLLPYCKDQLGVVFSIEEFSPVAKVLHEFAKKNEALRLIVGSLDSQLLNEEAIVRIASLPSKGILLAQVCGTVKAPLVGFVRALNMLITRLLWVLKEIERKKQQ